MRQTFEVTEVHHVRDSDLADATRALSTSTPTVVLVVLVSAKAIIRHTEEVSEDGWTFRTSTQVNAHNAVDALSIYRNVAPATEIVAIAGWHSYYLDTP